MRTTLPALTRSARRWRFRGLRCDGGATRHLIAPNIAPADLVEPLIDIKFDANGKPYVKLPAIVNTEGAAAAVLATEDISDWSHAANYPVDPATGICAPDFDPVPLHMFFRFRLTIED